MNWDDEVRGGEVSSENEGRGIDRGSQEKRPEYIPFAPPLISEDEIDEVVDTLRSGWLTTGPKTKRFEEEFARYVGSEHAVAVSSCTAAMHLALVAAGVGPGDEVITTPFTFVSTVNVILHVGATPVFVDIRPDTFNIDAKRIEAAVTSRTKAILPVHYAGQPCDMEALLALAADRDLLVVEDAAHAVGAEYCGKKVGGIGDITCFSFYATKNLTTGEGGMVTTAHDDMAERIRILSLHGMHRDAWKRYTAQGSWFYEVVAPGYKYNMSDIQAALGLRQLEKLDGFQDRRRSIAQRYSERLGDVPGIEIPYVSPDVRHAWHLYVIQLNPASLAIEREEFIEELKAMGIGVSVHFIPVHLHPYHREALGYSEEDFPVTGSVYRRVVSLPISLRMTDADIDRTIEAVSLVAHRSAR